MAALIAGRSPVACLTVTAVDVLPPADAPGAELPPHVRAAFGVTDTDPLPVTWAGRRAWHCGGVLVRPVPDNVVAAWSSGVLDGLPPAAALRRGTITAAFAVAAVGDWEGLPTRDDLSLLDTEAGATLR